MGYSGLAAAALPPLRATRYHQTAINGYSLVACSARLVLVLQILLLQMCATSNASM